MSFKYELVAVLCLLLTAALGLVKLEAQHRDPPPYAQKEANNYRGYVSIDRFGQRAELMLHALEGGEQERNDLREFVRGDHHQLALLVPAIVAIVAIPTDNIVLSFVVTSLFFCALLAWLTYRLALDMGGGEGGRGPWLAVILLGGHILFIRTTGQLILDGGSACIVVGSLLLSMRWAASPTRGKAGALLVVLTCGVFTKLSCLPILSFPLVALLSRGGASRTTGLVVRAALMAVLPLVPAALYLWNMEMLSEGDKDFRHFANAWSLESSQLEHFTVEMVLLFQAFPLALLYVFWRGEGSAAGLRTPLAMGALLLLATWSFGLPAVPRLYLPVLPILCAVTAIVMSRALQPQVSGALLAAYLLANYGASVTSLLGYV